MAAPQPTVPERAAAGVLTLVQLDCEGWIGEAMLVVGPDGTSILLDVGNDEHAAMVAAAVESRTGGHAVDAIVLTHFHEDHVGGLDAVLAEVEADAVVSRGATNLDAVSLPESFEGTNRVDLCTEAGCTLPWTLELGEGARFTVFAANGVIGDEAFGSFPADDDGENARSLVGTVSWGGFHYLFDGDLTGGGKDTPQVEQFLASRLDPWLPATGATIGHLGHHGIDSSTSDPWIRRVFPADGSTHIGLVGSNGSYLDAPADEVLDRVREAVTAVWVTRPGALTGEDPLLVEANDDVVIEVQDEGASFTISGGPAGG